MIRRSSTLIVCVFVCASCSTQSKFDYTRLIHLDSEDLCEVGIKNAYDEEVAAQLKKWAKPEKLESIEDDNDDYFIRYKQEKIQVDLTSAITCAVDAKRILFHVVNDQLPETDIKFYAFYHGHDLHGAFLTSDEVALLKLANPKNQDEWPYIPQKHKAFEANK